MRIDIITVLPEMFESPLGCSILQRAQKKGLVEFHVHNLRDYTTNKHRKVDDYPFGGEAGMVMQVCLLYTFDAADEKGGGGFRGRAPL